MKTTITDVWGREILDSRGNPTIEVEVASENALASAAAPSGASTGKHEAVELRDGGRRYLGKGVLKAVSNVNDIIAPAIIGMDVSDQEGVDRRLCELDATKDKSHLGANAMVATSMAVLRAAAILYHAMFEWDEKKAKGNKSKSFPHARQCTTR